MCEYRNYFLSDSIIASHRSSRPLIGKQKGGCPFCRENEKQLEEIHDEVWDEEKLLVRILANKYPAITRTGHYTGVHDVIVDTAHHLEHPKDFTVEHWKILLLAMQKRWHYLSQDNRNVFIQIFKNYGILAGASIYHSHWQLIALHQIPYGMEQQYVKYQKKGFCFFCSKKYLEDGFLIYETDLWRLIAPSNPEYNYEVWAVPKQHRQHYGELTLQEIEEIGWLSKRLLMSYDQLVPEGAFNICMMSGDLRNKWQYHFHIKFMMRVGHIAGFEIATHCHIIMVDPRMYALKIKRLLER